MKEKWIILRIKALVLASLCLIFSSTSCAASDRAAGDKLDIASKKVLVRIDDDPITEGEVFRRIQAAYGPIDRNKVTPNQWQMMIEAATDTEIIERLLLRAAISEKIEVPEQDAENAVKRSREMLGENKFNEMLNQQNVSEEEYRLFIRNRLRIETYKAKLFSSVAVSDEEVKHYYDGHRKDYSQPAGARIEAFTIKEKDKAYEIFDQWKKGKPFEKLSEEFSPDKERPIGRRLRWTPYDAMPNEVQAKVKEGKTEEILEPIKSDDTFYIIKILEKRIEGMQNFEEAKNRIKEQLISSRQQKILDEWYASQIHKVKIEYVR